MNVGVSAAGVACCQGLGRGERSDMSGQETCRSTRVSGVFPSRGLRSRRTMLVPPLWCWVQDRRSSFPDGGIHERALRLRGRRRQGRAPLSRAHGDDGTNSTVCTEASVTRIRYSEEKGSQLELRYLVRVLELYSFEVPLWQAQPIMATLARGGQRSRYAGM